MRKMILPVLLVLVAAFTFSVFTDAGVNAINLIRDTIARRGGTSGNAVIFDLIRYKSDDLIVDTNATYANQTHVNSGGFGTIFRVATPCPKGTLACTNRTSRASNASLGYAYFYCNGTQFTFARTAPSGMTVRVNKTKDY